MTANAESFFEKELPKGGQVVRSTVDSRAEYVCSVAASAIRTKATLPSFYTKEINDSVIELCNTVNLLGGSKNDIKRQFGKLRFMGYAVSKTELEKIRLGRYNKNFDCWYFAENDTIQIYQDGCMYGVVRKNPEILTHDQYIYSLNLLISRLDADGYIPVGERVGYFEIIYYGRQDSSKLPKRWDYQQRTNAGKTMVLFEDNRFENLSRINTWDGGTGVQNCFNKEVRGLVFRYRGGEEEYRKATKHMPGDVYSFKDNTLNTVLYKWYNGNDWFNNFDNPAKTNEIDTTKIGVVARKEIPVEDEHGFVLGETYCIESEVLDGSKNLRRVYVYKGYVGNIDGCDVDSVIMKQVGGKMTRLFTLTKNDCKQLGLPYEPGLQVMPYGLNWTTCSFDYSEEPPKEELQGSVDEQFEEEVLL